MNIVYKYYPPTDYTFDALSKQYFFFSKVEKLNDPYDSSFKLISSTNFAKCMQKHNRIPNDMQSYMQSFGTCSFSKSNRSKHLWSFYANNFSGLVVGFDEKKFQQLTEQYLVRISYYDVEYVDTMIDFDDRKSEFPYKPLLVPSEFRSISMVEACSDIKNLDCLIAYLCLVKDKATWGEEQERRLIVGRDVIDPNNRQRLKRLGFQYLESGYKIPMPKDCIREIIVGHNINDTCKEIVKRWAKRLGVRLHTTMAKTPFKIDIVPF